MVRWTTPKPGRNKEHPTNMADDLKLCPIHHRAMVCFACLGAKGGRAKSERKTRANRAKAQKRWRLKRLRGEIG